MATVEHSILRNPNTIFDYLEHMADNGFATIKESDTATGVYEMVVHNPKYISTYTVFFKKDVINSTLTIELMDVKLCVIRLSSYAEAVCRLNDLIDYCELTQEMKNNPVFADIINDIEDFYHCSVLSNDVKYEIK